MEIVTRLVSDVCILDLKYPLTHGDPAELFKDQINASLAAGRKKLVVNFERAGDIDVIGLAEVKRSLGTVKRQGGMLKLMNVGKLKSTALAVQLLGVFDEFDNENEAIKSFR